ncbi:MAG: acyl-CoA desaturase [Flavobacteriales bacterium]|nr:MAG: acyl-CoA desaturase [Flavobacteriales bacterium]
MEILIFIIIHWYVSLFCQTFFHHRYSAHKMFDMSKAWEKVFFILSFITQGSSYLSPYAYGILHRMHHAFADTEKDPHSPKYDKNLFAMMWRTKVTYNNILHERVEIEERFKKGVPQWVSFEKIANNWGLRFFWAACYITFYIFFASEWWMYLFLPIHFVSGPLHGAIINWCAHKYGYVNFKLSDTSKNFLPFDFLMLGESYHNNHHKHSTSPNFGFRWFELDPVYLIIRLFNKLKIIQLKV